MILGIDGYGVESVQFVAIHRKAVTISVKRSDDVKKISIWEVERKGMGGFLR